MKWFSNLMPETRMRVILGSVFLVLDLCLWFGRGG